MEWPCQAHIILEMVAIRNASGITSCMSRVTGTRIFWMEKLERDRLVCTGVRILSRYHWDVIVRIWDSRWHFKTRPQRKFGGLVLSYRH
jgi:hypothetical protein